LDVKIGREDDHKVSSTRRENHEDRQAAGYCARTPEMYFFFCLFLIANYRRDCGRSGRIGSCSEDRSTINSGSEGSETITAAANVGGV
jgi:hypothetical protein